MSKTKRQQEGDELLTFARATITKPQPNQIAAFGIRLAQIMRRDQRLHPETLQRGDDGLAFLPNINSTDYKDLTSYADAMEKIHHKPADAEYARAIALCMRACHAGSDYDRQTFAARACVKALYACGRGEEIKAALMLVF